VRLRGLFVSFTVLAVAFCAGRFSLPVFYPVFADPKKFGWSHAAAAGGGSIVLLLIGLLGPLVGWLCDKYSPKAVILGGCVTCAAAMALLSTTQTQLQWYLFCTLLGIGIAASSLVPASMLIAPWFAKQRGLAVGVINAGVGLGGYIFPKLATRLITQQGYSQAFLILSAFLAIPLIVTLVVTPRREAGGAGASRSARHSISNAGAILSNPVLWIFGVSLFFAAHAMTGVQEHLVLYMRGAGLKPADAAQALSTLLGSSAIGKLLGGAAADRFSSRVSMLLSTACLFVGCGILLAADPRSAAVYLAAAVFGLGFGGIFNAPSLIAFEYFGSQRVGTILGLFMLFFGLGTSSGGVVAGAIYDQTHRYSTAFTVDLLSCVLAFVLFYTVGRRPSPKPAPPLAFEKATAVKKIA
jgi:MFS family permease